MYSPKRMTTLPARREMERRLREVDDTYYVAENLHPVFLSYAGQHMTPLGILTFLSVEIGVYADPKPYIPFRLQERWVKAYLIALIKDQRARKEALRLLSGKDAQ